MMSNIPNLVYLSPTNKEEYLAMLEYSLNQTEHPIAIRVPMTSLESTGVKDTTDYSKLNKFKLVEKGEKVAILGLGNFFNLGKDVKKALKEKMNIDATLINPIFMTGVDNVVITLEDGILDGGFGEKVARYYGNSAMKVLNFGGKKEFTDRTPLEELYNRYHLTTDLIVEDVAKLL